MKRKEIIDLLSLGFISVGPTHGYAINEFIEKGNFIKFVGISKTSIYNSLKRAGLNGYAKSVMEYQKDRPPSYFYTITPKGWVELKRLVKKSIESYTMEFAFVFNIGMHFSYLISNKEIVEALEKRLGKFVKAREFIVKEKESVKKKLGLEHFDILMDSGLGHINTEIKKMDRMLRLYKNNPNYIKKHKKIFSKINIFTIHKRGN